MTADARQLTSEQLEAVRATGRSVIVTAAAGSGKTTVLAERCAYLVCEAPPDARCDVDELLVLTFTDAAAAEMRSRIVSAIRRRSEARPGDSRLAEQALLAESARISTIHSFCLWVIRRWFHLAGVDPTVDLLDAEEAALIRREVLEELFERRYADGQTVGDPLGVDGLEAKAAHTNGPDDAPDSGSAFRRLVDVYGLGEDRDIAPFVLRLHEFTTSLPDPEEWLGQATASLCEQAGRVIATLAAELREELAVQSVYCAALAKAWAAASPVCKLYAEGIAAYALQLDRWCEELGGPAEFSLERFDGLRKAISAFDLGKARAPRLPKGAPDETRAMRDEASKTFSSVKRKLFKERLLCRFGSFSVEEWRSGLQRIAPFVTTIVSLVRQFTQDYSAKKRRMNVLDFSDLERLAFALLRGDATDSGNEPGDVAGALRDRFSYVMVDEFQDINPLQQAILERVSRERDDDRPANFFTVGDVKQSIYRFRLAEPGVFLDRLARFRQFGSAAATSGGGRGIAVHLQYNFRSRPVILDAVNLIFRCLMNRPDGGISYDEEAELRPGRTARAMDDCDPVELHLVEREVRGPAAVAAESDDAEETDDGFTGDDEERGLDDPIEETASDLNDASRWTWVEREAYVIGSRIRELVAETSELPREGESRSGYGDIAILLRATKFNADRMSAALVAMGIPVHAEAGGSFFKTLEIRDVLSALRVLDNFQQDIPLAGVLRSGIFGDRFNADELVEFRLIDREIPFHAAVRQYAERGDDAALRERIFLLLQRIEELRSDARLRPLPDTLWSLLDRHGYLTYACGLPNGVHRRANLLKLHDLARTHSTFRRQGLHRFLRFVDAMIDGELDLGVATEGGEAGQAVRIMSIHHAKGLEFPIVFVAGLGTKFNLGDRSGRMIFERKAGIGLRVVDTDAMVEYPSATHLAAAAEIDRTARDEEARILYVAMTRARDRLFLVGSIPRIEQYTGSVESSAVVIPSNRFQVATARTPLDWLLPALTSAPDGAVAGLCGRQASRPVFAVVVRGRAEMNGWRFAASDRASDAEARRAVARLEALPTYEVTTNGDSEVASVMTRLRTPYPWLASSSVRATVAASEWKRTYDHVRFEIDGVGGFLPNGPMGADPFEVTTGNRDEAARRGVATHRVLQFLDFGKAVDEIGLASELHRMTEEGLLAVDDVALVNRESLEWFLSMPLAESIRRVGATYRRELRFLTTEPLTFVDATVAAPEEDRVLVRGIVDGILSTGDGLEIVDYKTDAISPVDVAARTEHYRPQMMLYARAVGRLWKRPVRKCRLVFLAPRVIETLELADGSVS